MPQVLKLVKEERVSISGWQTFLLLHSNILGLASLTKLLFLPTSSY